MGIIRRRNQKPPSRKSHHLKSFIMKAWVVCLFLVVLVAVAEARGGGRTKSGMGGTVPASRQGATPGLPRPYKSSPKAKKFFKRLIKDLPMPWESEDSPASPPEDSQAP